MAASPGYSPGLVLTIFRPGFVFLLLLQPVNTGGRSKPGNLNSNFTTARSWQNPFTTNSFSFIDS